MLKDILIGLMLILVTSTAAADEDEDGPVATNPFCEYFGLMCPYEEEDDGDWTELPPGTPPKQPKNPNPGCTYPDCGYED